MQLVSTPRVDFLRGLRTEITHNYPAGRLIVAIDGAPGSGTGEFADGLAAAFAEGGWATARASIEDFHRPRSDRYAAGRRSPRGYYDRSYDYRTLRRVLLDPFRMAGSTGFQTAAFDVRRDAPIVASWLTGPSDLALFIDGIFLGRPDLRGSWNYLIHLDVPLTEAYTRLAATAGRDPDPNAEANARYVGGLEIYDAEATPRLAANAVVDNSDQRNPRREFPDTGCACG